LVRIRKYKDYAEYLSHQKSKLKRKGLKKFRNRSKLMCRIYFKPLFESFLKVMVRPCNVLCLGARLGDEVKTWRGLGCGAIGIDLNPGPKNSYVLKGDFHFIPFKGGSFDYIYTNSLDHCLMLEELSNEMFRVLKPSGKVFLDLHPAKEEQIEKGNYWESLLWKDRKELISIFKKSNEWEEATTYPHIDQRYSVLILRR